MSLKAQIGEDIKTAMKARDKLRLETVRSIKKLLLEKESEIRGQGREALSADEELTILTQLAKQRREAIAQYNNVGREDLADQERQELTVIEEYLPQQLSEAEVRAVVSEIIAAVGASSPRDMGKVMGPAMARLKGKADGRVVQEMVKSQLAG